MKTRKANLVSFFAVLALAVAMAAHAQSGERGLEIGASKCPTCRLLARVGSVDRYMSGVIGATATLPPTSEHFPGLSEVPIHDFGDEEYAGSWTRPGVPLDLTAIT